MVLSRGLIHCGLVQVKFVLNNYFTWVDSSEPNANKLEPPHGLRPKGQLRYMASRLERWNRELLGRWSIFSPMSVFESFPCGHGLWVLVSKTKVCTFSSKHVQSARDVPFFTGFFPNWRPQCGHIKERLGVSHLHADA